MADCFEPRLDVLPAPQQRLWRELADVPATFTLCGGTAIALHLGHRQSIDFDFFGREHFDPDRLLSNTPFLRNAEVFQREPDTLTCLVHRDAPVQVSFFAVPRMGQIEPAAVAEDIRLKIASLIDLGGMKASVVQKRAQAKDYVDIDALITAGVDLPSMLAAASIIYGAQFNPQITLKALTFFDEGDLHEVVASIRRRLQDAVAGAWGPLPVLAALRPWRQEV